jgi:hypothetical protein
VEQTGAGWLILLRKVGGKIETQRRLAARSRLFATKTEANISGEQLSGHPDNIGDYKTGYHMSIGWQTTETGDEKLPLAKNILILALFFWTTKQRSQLFVSHIDPSR